MSRTLVIGVGNPLRGDDGVGVEVARQLARRSLPAEVQVLDGGTEGLDLIFHLEEADRLVLIDAADMGLSPGGARVFDGEVLTDSSEARFASTHGFGVAEVLALGRLVGVRPEVTVLGIQPADVGLREGLSEPLAARLDEYIDLAQGLIASDSECAPGRAPGPKE
jgi:hydrogenase maturation protease